MYKYEGLLIHESHDDNGILEVVEYQGVRSLHFGSEARQSSLRLNNQDKLELDYVRAMMSWLLFTDIPEQVLVIGLGGGSLTKFLLHHFPDIHIKAVEFRKSVVRIARSHFGLPLDPRLKIIIDDGGDFLRKRANTLAEHYQLVFLDAFDHEGMAESLRNEAFIDACKTVLNAHGILVLNLWSSDKALFEQIAWWLGRTFNWRIIFLPVPGKGNVIGFAFAEKVPRFSIKELRLRALELEQRYAIEFPVFLKEFKRNNDHILNKVIIP